MTRTIVLQLDLIDAGLWRMWKKKRTRERGQQYERGAAIEEEGDESVKNEPSEMRQSLMMSGSTGKEPTKRALGGAEPGARDVDELTWMQKWALWRRSEW